MSKPSDTRLPLLNEWLDSFIGDEESRVVGDALVAIVEGADRLCEDLKPYVAEDTAFDGEAELREGLARLRKALGA